MDKIAILDFGGQYAHLLANRIRRLGVYSEIVDAETPVSELLDYKGFILSGGPASVKDPASPKVDPGIFELGLPILGICYGHQEISDKLGGRVEPGHVREYGPATLKIDKKEGLFEGLDDTEQVWMSHFDQVVEEPEGFETVASSDDCRIAAMADPERKIFTIQFHPEVTHTPHGMQVLRNFVDMTDCKREWSMEGYVDQVVAEIQQQVGDKKVFLMVSGGVDSTVAFALLDKALGQDRVYGLFVDTGFMRMNERAEVEGFLKELGITNLHVYDASKEYFEALKGVYEPEAKRKIIGDLFIDIQSKLVEELGLDPEQWMLGQGTIYPDTIETGGTKHAHTIKTHHNRVERIQKLIDEGKVVEPLADLYKDEVRAVGEKLGLAKKMVWRHPFPGPGLAVRTLCAEVADVPTNVADLEAQVDAMVSDKGLRATVLPIKSVGVQGDERSYKHPVVLSGPFTDWSVFDQLAIKIINQVPELNRVLYTLDPLEINQIDVLPGYLTPERTLTIQQADKAVMDYLSEAGIYQDIWQFPTVLIPVAVNGVQKESIVLRPVCSTDVMSASFYQMEKPVMDALVQKLQGLGVASGVFYDITNKPPGTVEWE